MLRGGVAPLIRAVYRPVVQGRENVPIEGPVILAANHLSFFDSIVIPLVAGRPVSFLAKAEYFTESGIRGRAKRAFFTAIESVPVDRAGHRAAQQSLDDALTVLAAGRAFGIYPEGTRSRDGRLYGGRTGVGLLALASGAPVVPVAVAGTELIQPIGTRLPRLRQVSVRFGRPLHFAPDGDRAAGLVRREVTDRVMAEIQALSGQEAAGGYATVQPGHR